MALYILYINKSILYKYFVVDKYYKILLSPYREQVREQLQNPLSDQRKRVVVKINKQLHYITMDKYYKCLLCRSAEQMH